MITFYPGPSKVYPQLAQYLQDAYAEGVMSINHRSAPAMELVRETYRLLHEKLGIPAEYSIYFVSSATECWEIIAQSLTRRESLHVYNGAFGEKWAQYASRIKAAVQVPFGVDSSADGEPILAALRAFSQAEVVCLTQNETSNGTQIPLAALQTLRQLTKDQSVSRPPLLAIDATSSMAGVEFDWHLGDVWYASVQKCFGLPAGMGLMVCSPRAVHRAEEIGERGHYNSLLSIHENAATFQTHVTPNVLSIYLMRRVLEQTPPLADVAKRLRQQALEWYDFLENETGWKPLVKNSSVRSDTVIAVEGAPAEVKAIKQRCQAEGIMLGNGYGTWKESTFRIANFPAIEASEISQLKAVLRH